MSHTPSEDSLFYEDGLGEDRTEKKLLSPEDKAVLIKELRDQFEAIKGVPINCQWTDVEYQLNRPSILETLYRERPFRLRFQDEKPYEIKGFHGDYMSPAYRVLDIVNKAGWPIVELYRCEIYHRDARVTLSRGKNN